MLERLAQRRVVWVAVLAAALIIRLSAAWVWQARLGPDQQFAMGDSVSYWVIGKTVAQGEPYSYGGGSMIFRTPGYPAILAMMFWIFGLDMSVMTARALNALFGVAAVGGVALLARQLYDAKTALIAATLTTLYPGAIVMSVLVLSEAPFCPLMLAHLIAWAAAHRSDNWRSCSAYAVLGGVAAGVATLVRPSWLLFTPFAIVVALPFVSARRRVIAVGLTMILAMAAVMSPWWMRNYRLTGEFVLTTSQVGASLYDGLSPDATGASEMSFVRRFEEQLDREWKRSGRPHNRSFELELDQRMKSAAVRWAKENPADVVRLMGVKLARMWNLWPNAEQFGDWKVRLIVAFGFAPLAALAVWGAARHVRRGWEYGLCLAPAGYFTALHMVFVSSIRYRQPAMLAAIVLAAAALSELLQRIEEKD